jgi:flagellar capping protein FliD
MIAAVAATAVLGAALATGAGASVADAKQKKVAAAKYAKTMCGTYNKVLDDINNFAKEIEGSQTTDPAAFQSEIVTAGDALDAKLAAAEAKLKRVYPDVDGGKGLSKKFAKNTVELQTLIGDALDKFRAADATSPAFSGDVTVLGVALTTLSTQLSDVTQGVTNQDFIGAIGDEKSCHEIFPVTGG